MNQDNEKVDFIEIHCYKLNRILLSMLKLWPYDRETIFTKIYRVFIFIITLSIGCVQLTTFYTSKFNIELLIMVSSYALPTFTCLIQYYVIYMQLYKVKQIWKRICEDYNTLKNEEERKIIQRYSQIATIRTIRLTVFMMTGFVTYVLLELSPVFLDILLPLTKTRPRKLHALTEYFIDVETYFYAILCHWLIGVFLDFIIFIAIFMFQMMYIHHICGLLKTACYRIQHSLNKYATLNSQMKECKAIQRIINAVQIHKKALKHIDFWMSTFAPYIIIGMIGTGVSLTVNLFRIFKAIVLLQNIEELITPMMFVIIQFLIILMINGYSQIIIDHHNEIFHSACNVRWYKATTKIQKLLLFIMKQTTKTYIIKLGYLMSISLEHFTKHAGMPISMFTTLYSIAN